METGQAMELRACNYLGYNGCQSVSHKAPHPPSFQHCRLLLVQNWAPPWETSSPRSCPIQGQPSFNECHIRVRRPKCMPQFETQGYPGLAQMSPLWRVNHSPNSHQIQPASFTLPHRIPRKLTKSIPTWNSQSLRVSFLQKWINGGGEKDSKMTSRAMELEESWGRMAVC